MLIKTGPRRLQSTHWLLEKSRDLILMANKWENHNVVRELAFFPRSGCYIEMTGLLKKMSENVEKVGA